MALNNTTADALATAICAALGVTDATTIADYKSIYRQVYASLKADIEILITANSITTTGTSSTQQGPTSNLPLAPQ